MMEVIFIAFAISNAYSQNLKKFQVLDQETQEPIVGLIFHYASQMGFSDNNGFIQDANIADVHIVK